MWSNATTKSVATVQKQKQGAMKKSCVFFMTWEHTHWVILKGNIRAWHFSVFHLFCHSICKLVSNILIAEV